MAAGQVATWLGASDGLWSDPTRWSTGLVPEGAESEALMPGLGQPYRVTFGGNQTIGGFSLLSPSVTLLIEGDARLRLDSDTGIVNNGTIRINDGTSDRQALLWTNIDQELAIIGDGEIRLDATASLLANRAAIEVNRDTTLNFGSGQRIVGAGEIETFVGGRVVLDGSIIADVPGREIVLDGSFAFGDGAVLGTANGGRVLVNGFLQNATILGDTEFISSSLVNSELQGVNGLRGDNLLALSEGLVNNGELVINTDGGRRVTRVVAADDLLIGGSGVLSLNAAERGDFPSLTRIESNPSVTLTIGPDQLVRGAGALGGVDGAIVVRCPVVADVPEQELELAGVIDLSQGGSLHQIDGGILSVATTLLTGGEVPDGVRWRGVLSGTRLSGTIPVPSGFGAGVGGGGIVNDGIVVINDGGNLAPTIVSSTEQATISGKGELRLNGRLSEGAVIRAGSGARFTLGPSQRVTGTGRLEGGAAGIEIQGVLDPNGDAAGAMTGSIRTEGMVSLAPGARLTLDIFSIASFDNVFVFGSPLAIQGSVIELRLGDGYEPELGDRFRLIHGGTVSGDFASVVSARVGSRLFRVTRDGNDVEAVWTCVGDMNLDGILSPGDANVWFQRFTARSLLCDQNDDTDCTPADFLAWVRNFNAGC
ncbi:MAG: hypothetical protein AAFS11_03530 [Planctomycetota bacterium]